jgi:predicted transcriptional regulator of viral defense system
MTFLSFKQKLKDFIVFNLQDIRKIESRFDLRRLNEWQGKGYVKMLRKGYYVFTDIDLNESTLFLIANKLYSPSYISLEMALSHYNLIPEAVYGITSVSSRKTNRFQTEHGEFFYRRVKPELLFGYRLNTYKNYSVKIAEMEKAVLDYFYLNTNINTEQDFAGLRFNKTEFLAQVDRKKLQNYLKAMGNKRMERRFNKFLKYINYD